MRIKKPLLAAALGIGLLSATSVHAALTLTLGGQGVYDTDRNITWLRDANLAATNTFGVSGVALNGQMDWYTAMNWVGAMNASNYLGYNDWRLPSVTDIETPGCNWTLSGTDCGYNLNTSTGEMAHLYFDELGNKSLYNAYGVSQPDSGLQNSGFFNNAGSSIFTPCMCPYGTYWSGTDYAPTIDAAWIFDTHLGRQDADIKGSSLFAWAVRDGDSPVVTSPVPEPEAYAMLLAGLGVLSFTAKRRKQSA